MTKTFTKIKEGVITPVEASQPVRCGFCPSLIYKHNEAGGRLHLLDGSPACARCRILKGTMGKVITRDKSNYEADLAEKENRAQAEADQEIRVIAHESQIATKTQISKE